jgi:hypothetical protein
LTAWESATYSASMLPVATHSFCLEEQQRTGAEFRPTLTKKPEWLWPLVWTP